MKTFVCIICLLAVVPVAKSEDDNVKKLTKASNDFSQRLYQEIALNETNSIYSPLSIHQALSMTSLGARGQTSKELLRVLGLKDFGSGYNKAHEAYNEVIKQLNNATDVKILTANALYVNPSKIILSRFINDVTNYYQAKVSNIDLNAPGGPQAPINAYVEDKTEGLIKDLLQPGDVTADTVMVLVNTLFFNGTWREIFHKSLTQESNFHTPSGDVMVNTMFSERSINIKRNFNGADIGELAFSGDDGFSLFIILPNDVNGLPEQERSLAVPGTIESMLEGLTTVTARISLPKVKIESTYVLNSPLEDLGIVKAFSPNEADFRGITTKTDVYISKVVHKAVIELTETGTVASAATAVTVNTVSQHTETFLADHPFLVVLYDKQRELILFQGKYGG